MKQKRIMTLLVISMVLMLATSYRSTLTALAYPGTSIYVNPPTINTDTSTTHVGDKFNVSLAFSNMTNLYGLEYQFYWNTSILNVTNRYDSLPSTWTSTFIAKDVINQTTGFIWYSVTDTGAASTAFNGSATFRTITFQVVDVPTGGLFNSTLLLNDTTFGNNLAQQIPAQTYSGQFIITYVVPEYSTSIMLLVIVLATSAVAVIYRKKH